MYTFTQSRSYTVDVYIRITKWPLSPGIAVDIEGYSSKATADQVGRNSEKESDCHYSSNVLHTKQY